MSAGARFRALLAPGRCLVTPGCHDALSARIAERAGFTALAIGGFAVEASLLGTPDIGLLSRDDMVTQARRIAGAVQVPVTCDGEAGFGSLHTIARLVRELEAAGIAGVQIEDQAQPRPMPMSSGRSLAPLDESVARIRAAVAARRDPHFVIIARSDADVDSTEAQIERCNRYLAAGADMAMPITMVLDGRPVAALDGDAQMDLLARLAREIDGPVKAMLVPSGYRAEDLGGIGFAVVGLTGGAIEAAAHAMDGAYRSLREHGSEAAWRAANNPAYPAPAGLAALLGAEELRAFEDSVRGEPRA